MKQGKANRVLSRERTGHSKHSLPTTQEKTLYMDSTRNQHRNQIDYILCSQRWRSSLQSAKTRLGADCGSDHELLIAKFRLKLKKGGKTTRPFRYTDTHRHAHTQTHTHGPVASPRASHNHCSDFSGFPSATLLLFDLLAQ